MPRMATRTIAVDNARRFGHFLFFGVEFMKSRAVYGTNRTVATHVPQVRQVLRGVTPARNFRAEISRRFDKLPVRMTALRSRVSPVFARPISGDSLASRKSTTTARGATRILADRVAEKLTGPVLQYSDRQRLLRLAGVLGIGRFDANLIIAAVQHRAEPLEREVAVRQPMTMTTLRDRWFHAITLFGLVQLGIVIACSWLLLG